MFRRKWCLLAAVSLLSSAARVFVDIATTSLTSHGTGNRPSLYDKILICLPLNAFDLMIPLHGEFIWHEKGGHSNTFVAEVH